jgi:outer membrane protein assembly factor BamD (BamD/ComL family)
MIRGLRALPLLLLLAACSTTPASFRGAARLVAHADDLAEQGHVQEASHAYERVVREYPTDPAAAAALYGLGRLQAAPASPLRNYRAAHATFSRLLAEYPQSRWEREARAWRAVLADLLAREEESTRLRAQIERLRRTDLDLERRP